MTNKYLKKFKVDKNGYGDVYSVFKAFDVNGIRANSVKKLLMAGNRGYKGVKQDLEEAINCIKREIELLDEPNTTTTKPTGLDGAYDDQ